VRTDYQRLHAQVLNSQAAPIWNQSNSGAPSGSRYLPLFNNDEHAESSALAILSLLLAVLVKV